MNSNEMNETGSEWLPVAASQTLQDRRDRRCSMGWMGWVGWWRGEESGAEPVAWEAGQEAGLPGAGR